MGMSRLLNNLVGGLSASLLLTSALLAPGLLAGEPGDIDLVILDNEQRIPGTLAEDPASADYVLIKTINGTLRLHKARVASIELGVTSRFKQLKDDDLDGLVAFARWCRTKGYQQAALTALDKAFIIVRVDPKRTYDLSALALYARITDEQKGPETALPLYRWYRANGGRDPEAITRLDELEAIVGRVDTPGLMPPAAAATAPTPEQPVVVAGAAVEGLETKGWLGEAAQWSNPVKGDVQPLIGDDRLAGVTRALTVTFGKGGKDKAAIKKSVNLDATEDHVLTLRLKNKTDQPLRVSVALKTGQWIFHESQIQVVKADEGWKELRFDLKEPTFKSEKSKWANNAAVESLDDVKEVQILIYNKDAEGSALISGMKFLSDKEL